MEVYVDDMLVKSLKKDDHVSDLREMFALLRKYNMKLNLAKCTFRVGSRKFMGFMVNHLGIEANPSKVQALLDLQSQETVKDIHKLTVMIVALSRFISKSTDKCRSFFQALKMGKNLVWSANCEEAFQQIKQYLGGIPMLAKQRMGKDLTLYLSVSEHVVSGILVKDEVMAQTPICYVSKALQDAETRYPEIDKLALALVVATRKLRPYFQSHVILVAILFAKFCKIQMSPKD